MPYLSRVRLNPLRRGAQRLLANPHVVHAAVLGGMPEQPVRERTLWRLEVTSPHVAELLVLTQSKPAWDHIVEQAGWPGTESASSIKHYGPLLDLLHRGREFSFRLRANTVSATRSPDAASAWQRERLAEPRARGVRVPERTVAHQSEWFLRHLPRWGFEVLGAEDQPALRLTGRESLDFVKGEAGARRRVQLVVATAEGLVRVLDPEAARRAVLEGCGRSRAYGCGLLTLAPTRREEG